MYRAAMVMMPLYERMGHTQWYQDMEILRESSWNYSRRWQAAGKAGSRRPNYNVFFQ